MTNILEIIGMMELSKYADENVHWEDITDAIEGLKKLRTQLIKMQEDVSEIHVDVMLKQAVTADVDLMDSIDDRFERILYEEKYT